MATLPAKSTAMFEGHSSCITSYVMRPCGNLWQLLKTLMQFKRTDLKQNYVTMILLVCTGTKR